jgi:hypothetical protein
MPRKIFYSWQSWLPNACNRGLIHDALEAACDATAAHVSDAQRPEVDRDTLGVPGAPDIVQTIFAKIDTCDAFVGDVSLITWDGESGRSCPNPNVLIELGYAIKTLGWERIILVLNTHFGPAEALPFDLKTKRITTYCVDPNADTKAVERKRLTAILTAGLKAILEHSKPISDPKAAVENDSKARLVANLQLIKAEALQMTDHADELNKMLYSRGLPRDEWTERLLRLLHLRFDPDVIDGALLHVASELNKHRFLGQQLNALRRTARAADREAARIVEQHGDTGPLHRQVQELMTTARSVVSGLDERIAAVEKELGS